MPFLENVLRGRNVPRERMLEVAEHYYHFGDRSPINDQNRELIAAIETVLQREGPRIPVYWGNRNWSPFLADTMRQMRLKDGSRRIRVSIEDSDANWQDGPEYILRVSKFDLARVRFERRPTEGER